MEDGVGKEQHEIVDPAAGEELFRKPTKQGQPQSDCCPGMVVVCPEAFVYVAGNTLH